jgi:hypothetical protein
MLVVHGDKVKMCCSSWGKSNYPFFFIWFEKLALFERLFFLFLFWTNPFIICLSKRYVSLALCFFFMFDYSLLFCLGSLIS